MSQTHRAHLSGPRTASRRSRVIFAVLGATLCLGIAGTGIAFGYWSSTDSSNPAHALANTLPQGATPSATVTPANSNTVVITFAEVATASGAVEIPASDYILKAYPAGGSSPTTVTGSCSGTGTITCIVSSVPDGSWQYTDTPTYATNWVGIESAKSGVVTVSLPATVTITYPVDGTTYGADWTGTITGTASGATGTTISSVQVAIEDTKTGKWWSGTGFSSSTQTFVAATSGTTTWFLTFAASDLAPGDSYSVIAQATDSEGNVGTSSTVTFTYYVNTGLPTVTITYPVNNTTYGADWTGTITGSAWPGTGASITATELAIEDTTTNKWWNGSGFTDATQMFVPVSGTTTWYLGFAATNLTSGNSYALVAKATDSNGNIGTSSTVTFTYAALPTVTITYPCDCETYGADWTGTITGTASPGPGTTITGVAVAIEDTTTKLWWNGTSFSATSQTFVAATGTTTWYLPLAGSNLTSGNSYSVIAQATDNLGNIGTSWTVTFTYFIRTGPPTVTITYPVNNTTYGADWTGVITGTASSNSGDGSTITSVSVAIEDTTTGKWWNGSSFSLGTEIFFPPTGNTTWMFTFGAGNLTSGHSYSVVAEATDSLGKLGTSSPVTFTYGIAAPVLPKVIITYPVSGPPYGADWAGAITGTASDTAIGIVSVKVSVQLNSGGHSCWTGSGNTYSASCPNYVPVTTGTTSWSLTFGAGNLTSGDFYTVLAQATDGHGNTGTSSPVSFTYNTTAPTVAITYPVNNTTYGSNWGSAVTGTASGPTVLSNVKVSVQQGSGGNVCWTGAGSTFTAACPNYLPVTAGTTNWSLSLGASSLTNGDSYTVVAQATDSAGNVGTSPTVAFTYSTTTPPPPPPPPPATPPTVTITYPVNGTIYGTDWTGTITGTASSNSGTGTTVKTTQVAIEDTTSKLWWTGTSFSSTSQTFVTAGGTTNWSLALPVGKLTSANTYTIIAKATDSLGNTGTSATVSFTYSTAPPTVTITYPVNGATYDASILSWKGAITGTASDSLSAVTSVKVSVQQGSGTSSCWTGSGHSFTASCPNYLPVTTGTTKWSLSLPASDLTRGDSYKVTAEATDSLGNMGTSSTVTFSYKTKKPKVFKVYPRYMGDCGGQCSTGIYWTITGSNFVPGATVSFPSTGPSADFRVVSGSVNVVNGTTIVLLVKDTGATKGKATVVVTDPGEAPAFGSIIATGKPDPTSLSIIGPSDVAQGAHTILRLKVSGTSCSTWGSFAVYFSNPGITGGKATCSGGIVSVPITVSSSALTGNSSVTVLVEDKDFALSTNGLTVEVTPRG